ncbi:hypothetical protein GCM10025868_45380 [Angustibacter aerolatus]|uniref:Uncharacterized protein n=1 Tax=Angustibacter aerolatus TaxID=1162965 RepID=A0ABQ6JMN2_9ACTN|nr:hypothetical protein GCM10025868_45380 [Angustibacter aerolatus]
MLSLVGGAARPTPAGATEGVLAWTERVPDAVLLAPGRAPDAVERDRLLRRPGFVDDVLRAELAQAPPAAATPAVVRAQVDGSLRAAQAGARRPGGGPWRVPAARAARPGSTASRCCATTCRSLLRQVDPERLADEARRRSLPTRATAGAVAESVGRDVLRAAGLPDPEEAWPAATRRRPASRPTGCSPGSSAPTCCGPRGVRPRCTRATWPASWRLAPVSDAPPTPGGAVLRRPTCTGCCGAGTATRSTTPPSVGSSTTW